MMTTSNISEQYQNNTMLNNIRNNDYSSFPPNSISSLFKNGDLRLTKNPNKTEPWHPDECVKFDTLCNYRTIIDNVSKIVNNFEIDCVGDIKMHYLHPYNSNDGNADGDIIVNESTEIYRLVTVV